MNIYKAMEPEDGVVAQFAAVHLLRWRREWGEPKLLFVEAEPTDLLKEERVKALVKAARNQCQTLTNLATSVLSGDDKQIALNAALQVGAALAAFEEALDG